MNRVITSLIAFLAIAGVRAEHLIDVPKLVVNITIDELREDYLQYCNYSFGERGFKRLLTGGLVYRQMQFDFPNVNQASAVATIFSGANPCYTGIVAEKKYDFESQREVSILYDKDYLGNYTTDKLSPLGLMCTTVGDELKMATDGYGMVFSIAPNAVEAILSAGRYGNGAFWLEDYKGRFATSTYYKEVPWYIERYNATDVIGKNDNYIWDSSRNSYNAFPYGSVKQSFRHTFSRGEKEGYIRLKTSPGINEEITKLAAKIFEYEDFKIRTSPCMLSLTYYAGNYLETIDNPYSSEIQDNYLRLDKEIEKLLDLIEKHVGLKNTLVVVTSTGYFTSTEVPSDKFKPAGEFYPNRCTALLNMYLMNTYGQGNWVTGFYNNQIYLNRKLIEDQKLSLPEIQRKSAEFTNQFSGIQGVTIFSDISEGKDEISSFRKGMYRDVSGDLFIELQPGRLVINEKNPTQSKYTRNNAVVAPLIFFGSNIQPQRIYRTVKATEVAPTVSHILRIRPPNGCKDMPLQEFIQ